jgi:ribose 5-phosphate isomerase B
VAANKIPGVRAGNCSDTYSAHQGVEHDAMNVLVLGGRTVGSAVAAEMVRAFLAAEYTREARHEKRLAKVIAIEERYAGGMA